MTQQGSSADKYTQPEKGARTGKCADGARAATSGGYAAGSGRGPWPTYFTSGRIRRLFAPCSIA